ncbi:hypothetical protein CerSpe_015260 [Prunus speciosa]
MNQSKDKEQPKDGGCQFEQLPQALVMDIFSRLTIKTLLICKCFCKEWLFIYLFFGLGFSALTIEYKVMRSFYPPMSSGKFHLKAEIYTIGGTGVWRSIENTPTDFVHHNQPLHAFMHGAHHWVARFGNSSEFIHSFNFETEKF